jgi:hypothetical protein
MELNIELWMVSDELRGVDYSNAYVSETVYQINDLANHIW